MIRIRVGQKNPVNLRDSHVLKIWLQDIASDLRARSGAAVEEIDFTGIRHQYDTIALSDREKCDASAHVAWDAQAEKQGKKQHH